MNIFNSRYFVINKILLMSFGLWPYQNPRKKFYIRICMLVITGVWVMLPQTFTVYKYFGVNMDLLIEHAAILLYILSFYCKYLISIITEKKLKAAYDNVEKNWKMIKDDDEVNILLQYSENGRTLTIGYIMYMIFTIVCFVTLPAAPMLLDVINPLNQTRPRFFILGGDLFIDKYEHYTIVYVFDIINMAISILLLCAVDSMYATCIEHCLGLFAIISFTKILESSYSSYFLILIGLNIIFLSFECIIVLMKLNQTMELIRYILTLVGLVVHLFYVSWPGQKLINFSLGLFTDAYYNEWYECPIRAQKLLGLMTLRCSKPCQLTAGGLYIMNFSNFAKIVKTSMSYMTVLTSFR